jgi:hypothetical protein
MSGFFRTIYITHRWFSGRMLACHAGGPGSIPGRCSLFFLFIFATFQSKITQITCRIATVASQPLLSSSKACAALKKQTAVAAQNRIGNLGRITKFITTLSKSI